MGVSYVSGKPVFSTFVSKLPATLLLAVVSILLTVIVSIPLGIWSAVNQNRAADYVIRTASFVGNSLPNFFVSLLLMYFFAIRLNWFPVISRDVSLQSVALPSITLAIAMSAKYLRQVRATVLDELSKDYVLGAKARGVKFQTTMMKSVMKASLVTIITHLHVGRRWQDGGGCHQYARLSDYSGLRHVDGDYLRAGQSDNRCKLSVSGSADQAGRNRAMSRPVTIRVQKVKKNRIRARLFFFLFLAVVLVLVSFFADQIVPYDPYGQDLSLSRQPPSAAHFMGTDQYGRDVFSRVVVGAQASVFSTLILGIRNPGRNAVRLLWGQD